MVQKGYERRIENDDVLRLESNYEYDSRCSTINCFNLTQEFSKTGTYEIETTLKAYETGASPSDFYSSGLYIQENRLSIEGTRGQNAIILRDYNSVEKGRWDYPTGYSAGDSFSVKILIESLPTDFQDSTQYIITKFFIRPTDSNN